MIASAMEDLAQLLFGRGQAAARGRSRRLGGGGRPDRGGAAIGACGQWASVGLRPISAIYARRLSRCEGRRREATRTPGASPPERLWRKPRRRQAHDFCQSRDRGQGTRRRATGRWIIALLALTVFKEPMRSCTGRAAEAVWRKPARTRSIFVDIPPHQGYSRRRRGWEEMLRDIFDGGDGALPETTLPQSPSPVAKHRGELPSAGTFSSQPSRSR